MGNVIGLGGHLPAGDTEGSSVQATLASLGAMAGEIATILVIGLNTEGQLMMTADRGMEVAQALNLTVIAQRILTDQMMGKVYMEDDE